MCFLLYFCDAEGKDTLTTRLCWKRTIENDLKCSDTEYSKISSWSKKCLKANHLSNTRVVLSDRVVGGKADIVAAYDYYPFGLISQKYEKSGSEAKYLFNGKEMNKEWAETYDYGERNYDPRIGRFMSVDPKGRSFPWTTGYSFAENDVIRSTDLDGGEKKIVVLDVQKGETVIKTFTSAESKEKIFYHYFKLNNMDQVSSFEGQEKYLSGGALSNNGTLYVSKDKEGRAQYAYVADPVNAPAKPKSFMQSLVGVMEKVDEVVNAPVETAGIGANVKVKLGGGVAVGGDIGVFGENGERGDNYGLVGKVEGSGKIGAATNGSTLNDKPGGEAGIYIFTQSNKIVEGPDRYNKQTGEIGFDASIYGIIGFKGESSIDLNKGNRTNKYGLYINTNALGGKNITDKYKVSISGSEKAGASYSIKTH